MPRTDVVTGSASGIGKATKELLESRGHWGIGVDLHDADVVADLATPVGRRSLVDGVAAVTAGAVDAVIACAGVAYEEPDTVRVNYFGTVATLEGLRPLLVRGTAPGALWAGAGSPLNGAVPGVVHTQMTAPLLDSDLAREGIDKAIPMPLGGHGHPEQVDELLAWLAGTESSMITGQVVFVDGGGDAALRGDSGW